MSTPTPPPRRVYGVSEMLGKFAAWISEKLPRLWVEGEISNLSMPASGHWYFTLKDAGGQVRCAMFRTANYAIRPAPKDGDAVLVRGALTLYPARGDLQLVVEYLELAGAGALLREFETLKNRLAAAGLFDEAAKRPLPPVPRGIGIITSASGAAWHDIVTTLRRRFPLGRAWLWPVPVQGPAAAGAIVRALQRLPRIAPVDVIILARGGGSLEDLWSFNDEGVARAIRACAVPVVTGVGHEIDFTIADFAADLRAPTPTGAAERVAPDVAEWQARLDQRARTLALRPVQQLQAATQQVDQLAGRLAAAHPGARLAQRRARMQELAQRLQGCMRRRLDDAQRHCDHAQRVLRQWPPARRVQAEGERLRGLQQRLAAAAPRRVLGLAQQLDRHAAVLATLDPRSILNRGYAIARRADGHVVLDAAELAPGERLELSLARGSAAVRVERDDAAGEGFAAPPAQA